MKEGSKIPRLLNSQPDTRVLPVVSQHPLDQRSVTN